MSELFVCPKCKETYFLYEGEGDTCKNCGTPLVESCEWCMEPEHACKCGKDAIRVHEKGKD